MLGAAVFGVQVVIVGLTRPNDWFLASGFLLAVAMVLAALAQSYAARRLSHLVESLLAATDWNRTDSSEGEMRPLLQVSSIFNHGWTVCSGIVIALFIVPAVVVIDRTTDMGQALRWFGIGLIEITTFFAGMAVSRAPQGLLLFHRLTRLRLRAHAFMYARKEVALFARVAAELATIVVLAYVLAFAAVIFSPVAIPTGVTIGYLSFGGVVTLFLFAAPQWQVSELLRHNKHAALELLTPHLDQVYGGLPQELDSNRLASLSQLATIIVALRATPEWVLDIGFISAFIVSGAAQIGVGLLQLSLK